MTVGVSLSKSEVLFGTTQGIVLKFNTDLTSNIGMGVVKAGTAIVCLETTKIDNFVMASYGSGALNLHIFDATTLSSPMEINIFTLGISFIRTMEFGSRTYVFVLREDGFLERMLYPNWSSEAVSGNTFSAKNIEIMPGTKNLIFYDNVKIKVLIIDGTSSTLDVIYSSNLTTDIVDYPISAPAGEPMIAVHDTLPFYALNFANSDYVHTIFWDGGICNGACDIALNYRGDASGIDPYSGGGMIIPPSDMDPDSSIPYPAPGDVKVVEIDHNCAYSQVLGGITPAELSGMNCKFCELRSPKLEAVYGSPAGLNYGVTETGTSAGNGTSYGDCLTECAANEYRNPLLTCTPCPVCCTGGCSLYADSKTFDDTFPSGKMACNGLDTTAFTFNDSTFACDVIPPSSSGVVPVVIDPPGKEDFLATNIFKLKDYTYKIQFNHGIDSLISVELGTNINASITNLVEGEDYSIIWTKEDSTSYVLRILLLNDLDFIEELSLSISNVYANPSLFTPLARLMQADNMLYPQATFLIQVKKVTPLFGMSPRM